MLAGACLATILQNMHDSSNAIQFTAYRLAKIRFYQSLYGKPLHISFTGLEVKSYD